MTEQNEFEIPTTVWTAMASLINTHHPHKISGRQTVVEGVAGLVVTLHCSEQRDGDYKVRYLVIGNGTPIQLPINR